MEDYKQKWAALEKKMADLEKIIQGQQKEIDLVKAVLVGEGVSQNYFSSFPVSHMQSGKRP